MRDLRAIRDAIFEKAFANNEMRGTAGAEIMIGTRGPDAICGEGGNDIMKGGAGNDFIEGCWADDILWGGAGRDVFQFYVYSSHDVIKDWQDRQDILELAFTGITLADVQIVHESRLVHTLTVKGHPEFSVEVIGRGFGLEDVLLTNIASVP